MNLHNIMLFGERHRIISAMVLLLITIASIVGCMKLNIDTSLTILTKKTGPSVETYHNVSKNFGSDDITVIYFRDNNLFTPERLKQIEDLTYELCDLPFVEDVESIFSMRSIRNNDGYLESQTILDGVPDDPEEIAQAKNNALYSPFILNNYISKDANVTAINIFISPEDPESEASIEATDIYNTIESKIAPLREDFDDVFQVGRSRIEYLINKYIIKDIVFLGTISAAIIIISILIFIPTPLAMLFPLITAGMSILWIFGLMGFIGSPINILMVTLPSLLIVIGSTEDIHLLSAYLSEIDTINAGKNLRTLCIQKMIRTTGVPIILTALTTAVGFFSNVIIDIPLVRNFAYASSCAMLMNFIITVLAIPLLLSIIGPKIKLKDKHINRTQSLLNVFIYIREKHPRAIIVITNVIIAISLLFALRVHINTDPFSFFHKNHPLINEAKMIHDDLSGIRQIYLSIKLHDRSTFKNVYNLKKIASIETFLREQNVYDKIIGLADHISLINQEMHEGDTTYNNIPNDNNLIEQYLLFFNRSDLKKFVTTDYKRANIIIRHNITESHDLRILLSNLEKYLNENLDATMTHTLSGLDVRINESAKGLFAAQFQSIALLLLVIFVIMAVMFTSAKAGFISLIPNIIPIIIMFGIMGAFGINLNMGTLLVAVLTIGIAIDDTIHLFTRYNKESRNTKKQDDAINNTIQKEGLPVISTSISLAAGFIVFTTSKFATLSSFGLLASLVMITALIADLVLTPMLLKNIRIVGLWEIIKLNIGYDVLSKSDLFRGFFKYNIKKTILLSEMLSYKKGDEILKQDSKSSQMYFILEGSVELSHTEGEFTSQFAIRNVGEVFGEEGFSGEIDQIYSVIAISDVKLLVFNDDKIAKLMKYYPSIVRKIHRNITYILGNRLRELALSEFILDRMIAIRSKKKH